MKKTKLFASFLLAGIMASAQTPNDTLLLKKRIAVVGIKDQSGYQGGNASAALTSMLITELVNLNKYDVVEKEALGFTDKESVTAPQLKSKGVSLMITGTITEYGTKMETKQSGFGYYSSTSTNQTARVAVDLRIMSTVSGEIILAKSAVGQESKKSGGGSFAGMGSSTSGMDNTLLDVATRSAIKKCLSSVEEASGKVEWMGTLIKVNEDGTLIMKPGSIGGVKAGMKFMVYSKGESIIDPDTGLDLGSSETKGGMIQVTEDITGGKACKAERLTGTIKFKQGDIVKER